MIAGKSSGMRGRGGVEPCQGERLCLNGSAFAQQSNLTHNFCDRPIRYRENTVPGLAFVVTRAVVRGDGGSARGCNPHCRPEVSVGERHKA